LGHFPDYYVRHWFHTVWLLVQNNAQQRAVDLDKAIVFDKARRPSPTLQFEKTADFSAALLSLLVLDLPAGASSEADTQTAATDANSDARTLIVVSAAVVSAPFDIAFARGVIITVVVALNHNAPCSASTKTLTALIADNADVLNAVVRRNGKAAA